MDWDWELDFRVEALGLMDFAHLSTVVRLTSNKVWVDLTGAYGEAGSAFQSQVPGGFGVHMGIRYEGTLMGTPKQGTPRIEKEHCRDILARVLR